MQLPPEVIRELAPARQTETASAWERRCMRDLRKSKDEAVPAEVFQSIFSWTQAIQRTWLNGTQEFRHPPADLFSVGFIYVPENQREAIFSEFRNAGGFVFGAHVLTRQPEFDYENELRRITAGGTDFPLVVCSGQTTLHGCPPHPATSTGSWRSTCWVKNRASSPTWDYGILTCRHGFSTLSIGQTVSLSPSSAHSSPSSAALVDFDNSTIDAAVLEIPSSDWPGTPQLWLSSSVAAGNAVNFETAAGTVSGRILRTFLNPTYFGNLFGQRIITDAVGAAGDSGTLLVRPSPSVGLGIYIGEIPDGSGGTEGIFQSLEQAVTYFNLSAHQ